MLDTKNLDKLTYHHLKNQLDYIRDLAGDEDELVKELEMDVAKRFPDKVSCDN